MKLWSGQAISEFGSQISQLAIPWVALVTLHASAFEVATLGTVEFLPFVLLTLPAGVLVDRWPRRLVLILGDLGRAVLLLSIPVFLIGPFPHLSCPPFPRRPPLREEETVKSVRAKIV